MNKLTKLGVSALCGSLAAVSAANAGEMSVSGSANATWTKLSYGTTGNPLGMTTSLSFSGSGELDNGNAFSVAVDHDDQNAWSAANITLSMGGLGTFQFDQGGGTGLDRLDDKMPTAWEEAFDTGVGAGLQTVVGVGGQTDIEWAISQDMLPDGMSAYLSWSPRADGSKNNDKSTGGVSSTTSTGGGWDVVIEHSGIADGMNVFAGYSNIEQHEADTYMGDRTSYALGATYAVGSVTLGYQYSRDNVHGHEAATNYYENNAFGIAFNVNDDLSISYGQHKSNRVKMSDDADVEITAESLQAAYTMGGATIKIAETSVDNATYNSTSAGDRDATTIALSLAF